MCQVKSKKAAIFPRLSPIAALIASLATPFSFADYVGCNLDSSNNCYGVSPSYSVSISDENANEVAGRLESDNDADNSTVSVEGNSSVSTVFGGKSSNAGANHNGVTIKTGNTNQFGTIYGGYSESNNENVLIKDNIVTYQSESTVEKIYGGFADAGQVRENNVHINAPTVKISDSIYGGFSNGKVVGSNSVRVLDGTTITNPSLNLIGGSGNVSYLGNNLVYIYDDVDLQANLLIGGDSGVNSIEVSSNGVSVGYENTNTTVSAKLIAGAKGASDYFEINWVQISGGKVTATEGIYGAYKDGPSSGNINQKFKMILNKVEIKNNATVDANVYGAKAEDDVYIEKNRVLITNNSTVNGNVYAGYSAAAGLVESNDIVLLNSSNAPDLIAGFSENGDVVRNQVWVNNSNAGSVIAGASNGNGEVRENIAVIEGGSVDAVHGGLATLRGAIGNNVEITAGVIKGDVYGGVSVSDKARKNAVIVNGGSFLNPNGKIYAGVVKNSGEATDNTISLGSSLDANALSNVVLYGGFVGGTGDAISGNTLAVQGKGITVAGIENFENLYFILPESINANETVLTVASSDPTVFLQPVNVGVAMSGNSNIALKNGEKVTLLHNDNGLLNANGDPLRNGTDYKNASLPSSIPGVQGFSLVYNFRLSNDDTNIFATVDNSIPVVTPSNPQPVKQADEPVDITPQPLPATPSVREETKAVAESRLSTAAILNLASDHVLRATKFLQNNTDANVNGEVLPEKLFTPFLLSSLHRQKIRTGSHVKANGASTIVGGVWQTKLAKSNVNAGAFVEFGKGSHQTFNQFNSGSVYGKGNADYYGAGLLAQANFETAGKNTPYIEGTIRAGRINSDWHSNDLRDVATHQRAEYDIGSNYIGAHVGAGYRWQVEDNAQVDLYSQYLFNRLQDKSIKVALDPYYFNVTRSSRLRLGTRATWQLGEMTKLYAGAAFEREFAGTQYASAYSINVPAPSMKGNSGLFDVGFSFSPVKLPNLTTQLGVTSYTGTRRGVGADLEVKYVF